MSLTKVYHRTDATFQDFSQERASYGMYGIGTYFSIGSDNFFEDDDGGALGTIVMVRYVDLSKYLRLEHSSVRSVPPAFKEWCEANGLEQRYQDEWAYHGEDALECSEGLFEEWLTAAGYHGHYSNDLVCVVDVKFVNTPEAKG
jgi:hypothetical protein